VILRFSSDPDHEAVSKIFEKPDPDSEPLFNFGKIAGVCLVFINVVAEVQTLLNFDCVDGCLSLNRFSNLQKFRTRIRIEKFWNRSGV